MDTAKFREILRKSTEATTSEMLIISENIIEKDQDNPKYFSYEAHYKAHLYHLLLTNGVRYENLHLEWRPEPQGLTNKHIDIWYSDPEGEYEFLIEVKQVYKMNGTRDNISAHDYISGYTKGKEIKSGIIKDVIKLSAACGNNKAYSGVMLMFWADPKVSENLNLDSVRDSIVKQVKANRQRISTTKLELLWSSSRITEYKHL